MMKRLNIAITFDYELFFGENRGSYSSVLFEPTKELIDVLNKNGVSATFFVDICSLIQAEKYNQQEYIEGFKNQLLYMIKKKQDIQLHIHPHWLNSTFDGKNWSFNDGFYRLHTFGFGNNEENADKIIKDGIACLNSILKPASSEYRCIAFRAGGFCLQPHVDLIKCLYKNGIRIDSSVAPQLKSEDDSHVYDYRKRGIATNWFISSDGEWWEDKRSGDYSLFEVPVATVNKNPISFTYKRIMHPEMIKLNLEEKRGTYINSSPKADKMSFKRMWNYVSGYNAISLDAYKSEFIVQQVKRLINRNDSTDYERYVAVIGHPKLVTHNYLKNLEDVIRSMQADNRIRIMSIFDIWREAEFKDERK